MALPKVSVATYELTIPSTGERVSYRPFLVKEEKTLLMAMETGNTNSMTKAMQDIISSCTDGVVDVKNLAPFDLEYFFLQLRGKSVGDVIEIQISRPATIKCPEEEPCKEVCELSINVDEIEIDTSSIPESKIELTDTIGVKLMYPHVDTVQKYATKDGTDIKTDSVFKMINDCIEYIWEGEEIYKAKDATKKELNDFIESLDTGQFNKIREFFEGMPRIKKEVTWECPKCKKSEPLLLEGIDSFFG